MLILLRARPAEAVGEEATVTIGGVVGDHDVRFAIEAQRVDRAREAVVICPPTYPFRVTEMED